MSPTEVVFAPGALVRVAASTNITGLGDFTVLPGDAGPGRVWAVPVGVEGRVPVVSRPVVLRLDALEAA